ncbi:hypothetical protein ACLOJK_023640 [Asimina triloba]
MDKSESESQLSAKDPGPRVLGDHSLATLFNVRNRAEEELKSSLEQCYTEGATEGEWRFLHKLQEIGRRASRVATLEAKAITDMEALCRDLYTSQLEQGRLKEGAADLLSDLAVARVEQDEAINSIEVVKAEASGLLVELVASESKAEALRARGVDLILVEQSLTPSSRLVVELLFECDDAWVEAARLRVELKASQAEMERLQVV